MRSHRVATGNNPATNDVDVNFFNPGGSDTLVFNGTAANDVIAAGAGEGGGEDLKLTAGTLLSDGR